MYLLLRHEPRDLRFAQGSARGQLRRFPTGQASPAEESLEASVAEKLSQETQGSVGDGLVEAFLLLSNFFFCDEVVCHSFQKLK